MKRLRQYLTSAVTTILLVSAAGTALAVAGNLAVKESGRATAASLPASASDNARQALEARSAAQAAKPEKAPKTETQNDDAAVATHGHCVSYWAHQAKAQGLTGSAKGGFISSIAKDENAKTVKVAEGGTPDSSCSFQGKLDEAKAAQAAGTSSPGKSGEDHGKGKGKTKPKPGGPDSD